MSPNVAAAARVGADLLRGVTADPRWSVAAMEGARWSPVDGLTTATGLEVAHGFGSNGEAFVQGWRGNEIGDVSAIVGARWRF